MTEQLCEKTIHELSSLLTTKEVRPQEILDSVWSRIDTVEDKVNAYITETRDLAADQARRAESAILNNTAGALTGIPLGIKDIMCTAGIPTTCGSNMLAGFVPPYNATVVEKLYADHPVITGKLNMDEFAMGSSNETSFFGPVRNPWDLSRVPGGSSGGSAAAVAARECIASLGSDTGGSIRQPAAYCGVVGLLSLIHI